MSKMRIDNVLDANLPDLVAAEGPCTWARISADPNDVEHLPRLCTILSADADDKTISADVNNLAAHQKCVLQTLCGHARSERRHTRQCQTGCQP